MSNVSKEAQDEQSDAVSVGDNIVKLSHLGGQVPKNLHAKFKEAANKRNESVAEALQHAVHLYIDLDTTEEKRG